MIRGKPDFELRRKVEVFLIQVTSRNSIASGHLLYRGLIKRRLLLRFLSFDEMSPVQLRHVITGRARIVATQERGKRCDCGMSSNQVEESLKKRAILVGPSTVQVET